MSGCMIRNEKERFIQPCTPACLVHFMQITHFKHQKWDIIARGRFNSWSKGSVIFIASFKFQW